MDCYDFNVKSWLVVIRESWYYSICLDKNHVVSLNDWNEKCEIYGFYDKEPLWGLKLPNPIPVKLKSV